MDVSVTGSGGSSRGPTELVIVVLEASPASLGPWLTPSSSVLVASASDPTGLVAALRRRRPRPTHVLVCCHQTEERAARYVANVVSGALPKMAVAVLPARASGLAFAVVGARTLEGGRSPATVAATLAATLAHTISGFWVQRLSKVSAPQPKFFQHLASLFGSRGYLVAQGPTPSIYRPAATVWPAGPYVLLGATTEVTPATMQSRLGLQRAPESVPAVCDVKTRYGARGAEFVVLPEEIRPAERGHQCPTCRAPVVDQFCPFCHVHVVPALQESRS